MSALGEYLIGVAAAAMLCGIVNVLMPKQGASAQAMKLLLGLLMALSVVHPWVEISMEDLFGWTEGISAKGEGIAAQGAMMGEQAYRDGITQRLEAYILDEAEDLGADVQVRVELSEEELPVPIRATVSGALSPYARARLTELLTQDLHISREEIQWN